MDFLVAQSGGAIRYTDLAGDSSDMTYKLKVTAAIPAADESGANVSDDVTAATSGKSVAAAETSSCMMRSEPTLARLTCQHLHFVRRVTKKTKKQLTFKHSNHRRGNKTFAAVILIYCWLQVMITELPNHRNRRITKNELLLLSKVDTFRSLNLP